jgi:hypothetical protein
LLPVAVVYRDQLRGAGQGTGPEENRIDHAEHGGIATDADRERKHRDRRQALALPEHADAVADVVEQSVHEYPGE